MVVEDVVAVQVFDATKQAFTQITGLVVRGMTGLVAITVMSSPDLCASLEITRARARRPISDLEPG